MKVLSLTVIFAHLILCTGCGVIFYDHFEPDSVGSPPLTSPPGGPTDDSLNLQGPANSIVVISSIPLNSKAVKIERASLTPQTVLECVAGSGPHTSGSYSVRYKAYSVNTNTDPILKTLVKSSDGQRAFELLLSGGKFKLSSGVGLEVLPGGYSPNVAHSIEIGIDLDTSKFSVNIDGNVVALNKTFLDTGFNEVYLLRFEYPPPIIEDFPGSYVVDRIIIQK